MIFAGSKGAFGTAADLYRDVMRNPFPAYICRQDGLVTAFNSAVVELWRRTPHLDDGPNHFCGSFRLLSPRGEHIPHESCPMAEVLSEGTEFHDVEVIIERPDGTRVRALANPSPISDERGHVLGAINVFTTRGKKIALAQVDPSIDFETLAKKYMRHVIRTWGRSGLEWPLAHGEFSLAEREWLQRTDRQIEGEFLRDADCC